MKKHICALLTTLALTASACGTSSPEPSATGEEPAVVAESSTSSTSSTSTTAPEPTINSREIVTSIDGVVPGPLNLTAAGGISLELPPDIPNDFGVWHTQNCVLLLMGGSSNDPKFPPVVANGTSGFVGNTELTAISTADEWFAGFESAGAIAPEPTGETIVVLGEELDGYRIDGAFLLGEPIPDEALLNCAVDEDTVAELPIPIAGFSDVFVAETSNGILFANATGFTREQLDTARELLDNVLPTLERSLEGTPDEGSGDITTETEATQARELDPGAATFTAAGGFTVELPQGFQTLESQNCLVLFDATYTGRSPFPPTLAFGVSGFLGRNVLTAFSTPEEWFAAYENAGEPVPTPTNETISLLGEEFDGFRIDGAFADVDITDLATLSCATDSETLSDLQLFTAPYADVFTAATDDGLLVAIAHAFTEEEQLVARDLFDAILPTIEPLPPANSVGGSEDQGGS